MNLIKYKLLLLVIVSGFINFSIAQDIPQHVSYSKIYDLLDELATDGLIEINSTVKPYSRIYIAQKLIEASKKRDKLTHRQVNEIKFYLNDYTLELKKIPDSKLVLLKTSELSIALLQPAFQYKDSVLRARITPILGMQVTHNKNGNIIKRWYGAELQTMMGEHLSVYGSLRDISIQGELLARPKFLNNFQGYEYKESSNGGDFSDSRGGINYAWKWGSFGLIKDNIIWGDNIHGSNIISGRAPSFPMLSLRLKPSKWFEMNYIHGWLVSNVIDSTNFYVDNIGNRKYRMSNKFIAANLFTFTPIRNLNLSFGNSIIYAERNIHPAYLIPIAFYKSIDHTLTKGLVLENQNSQVFFNLSSRNIKHLHLYTSVFADEISISRFKSSNPENNPISFKAGAKISNFPLQNLSVVGEITRTNIITYKHSIPSLAWSSNNFGLGHYLSDNSQEIYLSLKYNPIRALDFNLSYTDIKHGNEFNYIRRNSNGADATKVFLSQPFLGELSWSNKSFAINVQYEILNNAYVIINIENSNIRGYDLISTPIVGNNSENLQTAQGYLDLFSPQYLQGKNTTMTFGFSFGF